MVSADLTCSSRLHFFSKFYIFLKFGHQSFQQVVESLMVYISGFDLCSKFPIHISLVQVCSLNRKILGFRVHLDYCNLVFFSQSLHFRTASVSHPTSLSLNMSHFSFCVAPLKHILLKKYCPKQIIHFNLQMTLHQL